MAGKRRHTRRNRRARPKRMRNSSILRNLSTGLRGLQSTRSLTFAPKAIAADGKVTKSWLETAFPYLVVAMKFVGALIAHPTRLTQSVIISSTIQSILISAEDILYDHPITTVGTVTIDKEERQIMNIDYSMVRLTNIKIVISLMGGVGDRAGRIAAVLIPLNFEKATELNDNLSRDKEVVDFKQLTQKPGAVVSPNLRPLTIVRKTNGFTARRAMLGDYADRPDVNGKLVYPRGGLPLFELIVGYQDMAATSSDPKLTYGLNEATLCVEISGNMILDAPVSGARAMRSEIRTCFMSQNVSAYSLGSRIPVEIPGDRLKLVDGFLEVQEDVDSMADAFEHI